MKKPEFLLEDLKILFRSLPWWVYSTWIERKMYKSQLVLFVLDTVLGALSYGLLGYSILLQKGIEEYGTSSALAFMVSGMAIHQLLRPFYQQLGISPISIYSFLSSPLPFWVVVANNCLSGFCWAIMDFAPYMVILLIFDPKLDVNLLFLAVFLCLSIFATLGLGLIVRGVILIVKQGDPVSWLIYFLGALFSGRIFPVSVLPPTVQALSWALPETWINYLWRIVLFSGETAHKAVHGFLILGAMGIILFATGVLTVSCGIKKIKREGLIL